MTALIIPPTYSIYLSLFSNKRIMSTDNKNAANGPTLYTIIVFSENLAGVLNQVTNVFTRRQLNIESLNVSPSGIGKVHRYTITCYSDEATIRTLTKQIEKKIDVIQAQYFTNDEIYVMEQALYKIATAKLLENKEISNLFHRLERRHAGRHHEPLPQTQEFRLPVAVREFRSGGRHQKPPRGIERVS